MAITVLTAAPLTAYKVRSGTLTSDSNGFISVNAYGDDLKDLLAQGCIVAPQVSEPSFIKTQFGSALNTAPLSFFTEEGNLYRNTGFPIAGNAAATTDTVLDGFQLPANAFDQANRGLALTIGGRFAANGNNKRVKMWINPTLVGATINPLTGIISGGTVSGVGTGILVLDSGVQTGNNVGFEMLFNIFKTGAANSNTQNIVGTQIMFGTTHGGTSLTLQSTQAENAAMNFVITGASPTTGAANDVLLDWTEANVMN